MIPASIIDQIGSELDAAVADNRRVFAPAMPDSALMLSLWSWIQRKKQSVIWVGHSMSALDTAVRDAYSLQPESLSPPLICPPWSGEPGCGVEPDLEITGDRLQTLLELKQDNDSRLVLTSIQAFMQRCFSRSQLAEYSRKPARGQELDLEEYSNWLDAAGYEFQREVERKGHAARRGGILDIWPVNTDLPIRIELFGPEVESIRSFDPLTQRSADSFDHLILPAASEWRFLTEDSGMLTDYVSDDTLIVMASYESVLDHMTFYEDSLIEEASLRLVFPQQEVQHSLESHAQLVTGLAAPDTKWHQIAPLFEPLTRHFAPPPPSLQPDSMENARQVFLSELLNATRSAAMQVSIAFDTDAARTRFAGSLPDSAMSKQFELSTASLSDSFVYPAAKLTVIAENDLYGRRKTFQGRHARKKRQHATRMGSRLSALVDLKPGDLVVHVEHGIGRYHGLTTMEVGDTRQEVLSIEYAEEARLHLPVSHAHLLSRYVGVAGKNVRLHQLGGRRWSREKQGAQKAVADLAAQLLETQAARDALRGHACSPDNAWQHDFDAAFPYEETVDQLRAIEEIKADMESERPMDRLICGDVGYGKTEVAMRAAFKTVMDGRQVALLVPTTVLAQQHYETFSERMSAYPVAIRVLSRFCTRKQHDDIIAGMADGSVDIVIGTHALVQPGITFKELGLVIIDEEQRFGVKHKEKLKQLRRLVDVLTMTATPIPRTLYLSLTGVKDLSTIQTAPRERQSVETIIGPHDDKVIRAAIQRELNRDGQVFFLHNRVTTIGTVERNLRDLVPEARIAVAHGQMASRELSDIMNDFVHGQIDVLLCTTIVESGVDIPNANTIIIDRADRFGLAELYQLRGRVGRSSHKAYAYLMLPEGGVKDPTARKRVQALKDHSNLGSAFSLALRDLEIRGAGNMLGSQQSGHIAAVGFQLYCQLLKRTVAQMKGEAVPDLVEVELLLDFISLDPSLQDADDVAAIPAWYIPDERLRVTMYRRVAELSAEDDIEPLRTECRDRFGPLPEELARLLQMAGIRILASRHGIASVETRDDKVILRRPGRDYATINGRIPRMRASSPDDCLEELHRIIRDCE